MAYTRRPTTRDLLERHLADWEDYKTRDAAWKVKHEGNHHGKWSQVKEHMPWSVLAMIGAGFVFEILRKL